MFLSLPFAIWLSSVSLSCCLWLWLVPPASPCVTTPQTPVFSWRNLGMDSCDTWSSLEYKWKPEGSCPWLFLGFCVLMALDRFLLGQEFEQKWWSYLYSQICPHSWETSSIPAVFGYGALWHRISSGRCGTGLAPDADSNWKDLVPGCSSVTLSWDLQAGRSEQK